MSKHSVIILELLVVTTCWSWTWSNPTSPSNGVGLGSPLAARLVYGDLTWSVHTVNNLYICSIVNDMPTFVIEDHMLYWHTCQICYPPEIKLLLLLHILVGLLYSRCEICFYFLSSSFLLLPIFSLLAHLSQRLTRWAYRIGVEPASVCACVHVSITNFKHEYL